MIDHTETKSEMMRTRADFAVKNYGRLGSSWAEFYGRDVTVLLGTLEAVETLLTQQLRPCPDDDQCLDCRLWYGFRAILEGGEHLFDRHRPAAGMTKFRFEIGPAAILRQPSSLTLASFPLPLCMQHTTIPELREDAIKPITTDMESLLNVLCGFAWMESYVEKDIACGRKELYWPLPFRDVTVGLL